MNFSLKFSADAEASPPDWEKAAEILSGWAQNHQVTIPFPLTALLPCPELLVDISPSEIDILSLFDSLTEPFYDMDINIEIERHSFPLLETSNES
ncbi:MAG: hypothetical protein H8E41_11240 [Desulfobulbaceae bacterium]|uniref:Uncharacterized protein n=1 Tax=Candidatus Desulfobia pelagia TaxID=2841692 RepID=A0A8J6TDA2_9BACT|nr:hypothetical protein [Candidatus Desulfobia pelagia]